MGEALPFLGVGEEGSSKKANPAWGPLWPLEVPGLTPHWSKAGLDFKQTPWEMSFSVPLTALGTRQSQGPGSPFDPRLQL